MSNLLAILKYGLWFLKRLFRRRDNPALQYETAKDKNAQMVVSGDAAGINAKLAGGLPLGPKAPGDSGE
ncbi:MAG: hypothetical protein ACTHLW_06035 [Verrucomicrobiota bacterium]